MRRDIVIGIFTSFAVHGFIWFSGHIPNPPPVIKKVVEDPRSVWVMPPIEPEKPEPIEKSDEPAPKVDIAPPTLPEILRPTADAPFTQVPQPPPPDGPRAVAITIPQGRRPGSDNNDGSVFDPGLLDKQPTPTYQAAPVYPFDMRRTGNTGQVIVAFIVDAAGNVQSAYAVSSTQREFESAAVQAVTKWKFRPGRKSGHAVATRMQVPIVFSISDERE